MAKVIAGITTSVDGYITGPDDVRQSRFATFIDYRAEPT
jgi:hypothetical protein